MVIHIYAFSLTAFKGVEDKRNIIFVTCVNILEILTLIVIQPTCHIPMVKHKS